MPNTGRLIADLRLDKTGLRGAFEEFCSQLFRCAPEVPPNSQYRRIRGDGGDGGVEALWTYPKNQIWGLQAKFFDALGADQKKQLTESVAQATANYLNLVHYTICLPFNLTGNKGAKSANPTQGQHQKLLGWIEEWRSELDRQGRAVEIDIWDESELLRRLAKADTTGGLTRYWFDREAFTSAWFAERLIEAKAQAGPRYSPELKIATPLDEALQAFGRTEHWKNSIEQLAANYSERLEWWRRTSVEKIALLRSSTKELVEEAQAVLVAAELIEQSLRRAKEQPDLLTLPAFQEAVRRSLTLGTALETQIRGALLAEHGQNADSPGFRQWSAENQNDFPMAPLDDLRRLVAAIREVEILVFQPNGKLPSSDGMLVRGEAGVGKTHGILDSASGRERSGLYSLVFFGENVSGSDPWPALIAKLGLGNRDGRDAILDALNAAGQTTGFPLIIFIDALNETQPDRRRWQNWLPPMLEQIKRRPFLKLCVSCRETYVNEVMPAWLEIPAIMHNGFLGREYEAQFAFFQHYGLGIPGEPLLQEEFANPLFLRLICEALRDTEAKAIPAGREGIRRIINLLLQSKNQLAARACDYDPREKNRVKEAMLRLAGEMASAGSRTLPHADARKVVDGSAADHSKSLFAILEAESLISIAEQPGVGLGADSVYFVRFTFERIGDHLIAEHLLDKITDLPAALAVGGSLHFLVASDGAARENAGLLEALSIQLPEVLRVEIVDALVNVNQALLWKPFIDGLRWRNPQFVRDRAVQLVRERLGSHETANAVFEVLLGFAARPDHPLNSKFMDGFLRGNPLLLRDPFWANLLEISYSAWSESVLTESGVYRLIESARRGNLENLPDNVGVHWAIMLAWFCASPNRRIRDRATMALVSIFRARPGCINPLLVRFLRIDDEYISERVLVAAYGGLLLNEAASELRDAATLVYDWFFADGTPPLNSSLRDHGRLIIELAVELGLSPEKFQSELYRPPYNSPWPIELPSKEDVKAFAENWNRFPEMNLVKEVGFAPGTDFARYVVERRVTDTFDLENVDLESGGILRWFLREAAELGYPGPEDACARFDRFLLGKFGGGRGKPGWAERLGKKYYWILLRQLVGQLADHVNRKTSFETFPPSDELQGLDLRDIDPTDTREFLPSPTGDHLWLSPVPYVFRGPDIPDEDVEWIHKDDLTEVADALTVTDPDGNLWQVLDLGQSWNGKQRDSIFHRRVTRSVRAAACKAADINRVAEAFARAPLDHFNHAPNNYTGYLGEYPRRWPYSHNLPDQLSFESEDGGFSFQYLALDQLRADWGLDHSAIGETENLLMPSVALVEAGKLHWDHRGGWKDTDGRIQILDPWWWSDQPAALICRADYLDRFLKKNRLALIILGFQEKYVVGNVRGVGFLTERTLFIRNRGKTTLIERNLARR